MAVSVLDSHPDISGTLTFADRREIFNGQVAKMFHDGERHTDDWVPVPVRIVEVNQAALSDFPYFAGASIVVFSTRASTVLADLLEPCGELLPLAVPGGGYLAYNLTCFTDAMDWQQSIVERYPDGTLRNIPTPVFNEELLANTAIFRVKEMMRFQVFVTDQFVDRVAKSKLTGFQFSPAT